MTPGPDILSQLLMAGPLFALYNISIVIVWLIERARKKQLAELEKSYAEGNGESSSLVPSDESAGTPAAPTSS